MIEGIKKILKSKMNEFVVESIVRVNCERIGTEPENLNESNLGEFIEKIKYSMLLFLPGSEVEELIRKIRLIKE